MPSDEIDLAAQLKAIRQLKLTWPYSCFVSLGTLFSFLPLMVLLALVAVFFVSSTSSGLNISKNTILLTLILTAPIFGLTYALDITITSCAPLVLNSKAFWQDSQLNLKSTLYALRWRILALLGFRFVFRSFLVVMLAVILLILQLPILLMVALFLLFPLAQLLLTMFLMRKIQQEAMAAAHKQDWATVRRSARSADFLLFPTKESYNILRIMAVFQGDLQEHKRLGEKLLLEVIANFNFQTLGIFLTTKILDDLVTNDLASARAWAQTIVRIAPTDTNSYLLLAETYWRRSENLPRAVELIEFGRTYAKSRPFIEFALPLEYGIALNLNDQREAAQAQKAAYDQAKPPKNLAAVEKLSIKYLEGLYWASMGENETAQALFAEAKAGLANSLIGLLIERDSQALEAGRLFKAD
jgi:hypothetical protein